MDAASDVEVYPDYYRLGSMDCLDVIREAQGEESAIGFCAGNCIKYLLRAPKKGGLVDYKKAQWYLERLIAMEADRAGK